MKSIYHKIHFHPLFLWLGFSCVITSLFKEFLIVVSLIFIHEIGHVLVGRYFKWNIKSITFYPFGGLTKFKQDVNTPLKEEFLVAISGILMQSCFFLMIYLIYQNGYMNDSIYNLFSFYHHTLLWFNILPIISLDGSKIVEVILELFLPYKFVLKLLVYLSYFILIILIITISKHMNYLLMIFFLVSKVYLENKNRPYQFQRFLLERLHHNYVFKRRKTITDVKQMMKEHKHLLKKNEKYYSEKEFLRKRFDINL